MERLAALDQPMSRLASLGSILESPWRLAVFALIGLAAWGVVTFGAVRMAIISAARATSRP
jgi:hypothetical protein